MTNRDKAMFLCQFWAGVLAVVNHWSGMAWIMMLLFFVGAWVLPRQ